MILGSIPTFFITGALVDEHFLKPFLTFNKMTFPRKKFKILEVICQKTQKFAARAKLITEIKSALCKREKHSNFAS